MERSIVTGKSSKQKAVSRKQSARSCRLLTAHCSPLTTRGFTLLELMIVISIIIILAAVALPQYQKTVMHARETVLRDDLFIMRSRIDYYAADKGKLPQSLEDLVSSGYLREIPTDPITDQKDWQPEMGTDPFTEDTGLINVHSNSSEAATDGTPYSEW